MRDGERRVDARTLPATRLVGTLDPAGTPWYDWEGEPEGYGVWFDCNGDGWPPTVEEYCGLRGEALPE